MDDTTSPALSEAAAYLSHAPSLPKLSNSTKLELYGLYKFLTVSSLPQTSRPSIFDMTGRAKWDAWNNIGHTFGDRKAEAEKRYLDMARELGWVPGTTPSQPVVNPPSEIPPGEVWDDELGMTVSSSSISGGGMGTSVSAMVRPTERGGEVETLHKLAIDGDADKITRFLDANPLLCVNEQDEFGYTPLHLACDRGNLPAVKVLLRHGGDPTLKDPDDLTVVELAEIAGHEKLSAFLREFSIVT